jgi:glycosyltransferase involved in cell wall biosynthesis
MPDWVAGTPKGNPVSSPALSVVIPNYNHAQYVPRCLEAMLRQSIQPAEILVLDDASTDNSVEVVQALASKHPVVRLHRNERNLGVVANVNRGIDLARGDYVFSAAADDEVAPGFFEKSLALLAKNPQAALCCTIGDYREAATGLNWHMGVGVADRPSYLSPEQMVEAERKGGFYIPPHSVIFRKNALLEVGGLRPELKYACDWFAMYVAGFRHGICFVPEPLAIFNVLPNSYYQRGRRDRTGHRTLIHTLLESLNDPKINDAAKRICRSGSLHLFGWPALRAVLFTPAYRHFFGWRFAYRALAHSARIGLKQITPTFLGNWYLSVAGYRASPTGARSQSTEGAATDGKRPA